MRPPASKSSGGGDLARRHPLGLALPERVVEVELAVARNDPVVRRDGDDGVGHARLTLDPLDHAGDDVHAQSIGEGGERPGEWTAHGLRGIDPVGARLRREIARVLGEDDQPGAPGRRELGETRDLGEVLRGVVARGELGDRDRECCGVAVHVLSLRRGADLPAETKKESPRVLSTFRISGEGGLAARPRSCRTMISRARDP